MAKRALVVGINDYSVWTAGVPIGDAVWSAPSLSCCVADADSFAQVLKDGFQFDEIVNLRDAQATSQSIQDNIRRILDRSTAGDVMCFYFSGHGGRMPEGPSATATRYYETIIPYDATMISSMDVAKISDSLPPSQINFTLVLDSCHSGGMVLSPDSRASIWSQELAQQFQATCQTIVPWICLLDPTGLLSNVSNLALQPSGICSMSADASKDNPENAKATLLSACDYGEESRELASIGHGIFTQAIIDVVTACNFSTSHSDFLTAVRARVAELIGTSQTPQLRGRPVRLQENFLAGWNYSV
jgi:hypothetical protein